MRSLIAFGIVLLLGFIFVGELAAAKKCSHKREYACYFPDWRVYHDYDVTKRYKNGLCSMILYAFAVFDNNFVAKAHDPWAASDPDGKKLFKVINGFKDGNGELIKQKKKPLRTLISIGGWTFSESGAFEKMAQSGSKTFIDSAIKLAREYNFDGVDIDWEYPKNKRLFTDFVKKMRKAIDEDAKKCKKSKCKRLLFTAAVAAAPWRIEESYEPSKIHKYFDYIFLMTYDFYGPWNTNLVGPNAPLEPYPEMSASNTIIGGVNAWVKGGVPKKKLIVGLASYGHGWVISQGAKMNFGPNGEAKSPAPPSGEAGTVAYTDICNKKDLSFDNSTTTAIVRDGRTLYSFDTVETFEKKEKWICDQCLGGSFIWDMSKDDFAGICRISNKFPHPLLEEQREGMKCLSKPRKDKKWKNPSVEKEAEKREKKQNKKTKKPKKSKKPKKTSKKNKKTKKSEF